MSFSICCDPMCNHSQKIIRSVLDQVEHDKHYTVNFDFLREEIAKINHPIKRLLKPLEVDSILAQLEQRILNIRSMFESYLESLINSLKNHIQNTYKEAQLMKRLYNIINIHDQNEVQSTQDELSKNIPKILNQGSLISLTQNVLRVQIDPIRCLEELESKIQQIASTPLICSPNPTNGTCLAQGIPNPQPRRYKNLTKNEADIVKQLGQEKQLTDLEIDLIGQMINRNDLRHPNEIFQCIRAQHTTLLELKITVSSTTISDLSELSRSLMYLKELSKLSLSFGNTKVIRVNELGKGLAHLKRLQNLELSLWSTNVSEINEIGRGIGAIKVLERLEIQLGNTFVYDVIELGRGIGENTKLKDLSLNLEFTKVSDIKELAQGIQKLKHLQEFELDLIDTLVHSRIRKNFFLVNHFLNDWKNLNK